MTDRQRSARLLDAWQAVVDPIAGSDPGFNRLRSATRGALTIMLALAAEWVFVRATGALEVTAPEHAGKSQLAAIAVQHHDILVVALLLGGLVGLLTSMNVNDRTLAGQAVTLLVVPAALISSLALGLGLGTHRVPALVVMVLVLTAGAYARRFGPRGTPGGILLFIGYFYGYFLSATLGPGDVGWLSAEIGLAVAAAAVVTVVAFRPSPSADLRRAMRSYEALVRRVLALAVTYFDEPADRRRTALRRRILRLDEAALIVEGQLDRPAGAPAERAVQLHQRLFDVELALSNAARFVELLATAEPRPAVRSLVREGLVSIAAGDDGAARHAAARLRALFPMEGRWVPATVGTGPNRQVVLHRYAFSIETLAGALPALAGALRAATHGTAGEAGSEHAGAGFQPAVTLRAGWLPGSADVSTEAAGLPRARVRLAPYLRTTAQMAASVSIAIVAGYALDAQRFYWAVVAAVLVLVGTNTVAEQLRKAAYRVAGTLVGVVVGTALVDAVGTHSLWSLVVVVVSSWLGMYLFRVNYAFMAMAVTISLSQAYLSLGEFSGGLLVERLAETAVGAGAAIVAVLAVVPLHTRRVLDVATADLVDAVASLADGAAAVLAPPEGDGTAQSAPSDGRAFDLRAAGRRLDAAYQALVATSQPLRMVSWADSQDRVARLMAAAAAARHYSRNMVFDTEGARPAGVDPDALAHARAILAASAGALSARLRGTPAAPVYTRAGALFGAAERALATDDAPPSPALLVLRDLALVDGTLARIATRQGMAMRTLDTDPAPEAPPEPAAGAELGDAAPAAGGG